MKLLKLQDGDLFYDEKGIGSSFLLLHAGIADHRMWDEHFDVFSQFHHVVYCDLRGYGKSHLPNGQFSYFQDILALVNELDMTSTWILGASFGAQVAVDFYLSNPTRVRGLVLVSPTISGFQPTDELEQFTERENMLLEAGNLEEATQLNLNMWVEGPFRSSKDVDAVMRNRIAEMQMDIFSQPFPKDVSLNRIDPPASERLGEIQVPVLIISGALDVPTFIQFSDVLTKQIPDATRVIIPEVAHMVSMEAPQRFGDLVLEFISNHEKKK